MTEQIVRDWIAEWNQAKVGDKDTISKFAENILSNEDLFQATSHIIEENERFITLYNEMVSLLFKFYQMTQHKRLQLFTIQFIPTLIHVYLNQVYLCKNCVGLETLLRGILQLENGADDGVAVSTRIPNINLPSIFHDPGGVSTSWIPEAELERLSARTVKAISRPILIFTEDRVRAPQRLPLCTELWWIFNHRLPDLQKHPIPSFLRTISRMITQGINASGNPHKMNPSNRLVLSSKLLIEMVHTIYFAVYNGEPNRSEQVLEEACQRANYHLWPDSILVCNAVENYLKTSDIPVQVEPSAFKKSIITNASFRTKKLPEDIPIVESESGDDAGTGGDTSTNLVTKSKSKLPHLLSKMKRNSVVVINEEGDVETTVGATPPERKKSIDSTAV